MINPTITIYREDVLRDRKAIIAQLMNSASLKHTGGLESQSDPNARCCLGHMCHALVPETRYTDGYDKVRYIDRAVVYAPATIVNRLGLFSDDGVSDPATEGQRPLRLAMLNDDTDATPQDIGQILQSNLDGESTTDRYWKPLSKYPERPK